MVRCTCIFPNDEGLSRVAENGDLETLQHYAGLGLLPNKDGAYFADQNGHDDVVEWLRSQGIVYP
jgi:hypothetical protein